jgi:hypothetical protein
MAEDVLLGAAVAETGDHRSMVELVREDDHTRQFARQGRQRRIIGDIARCEDQRRLAPVQVGKLALEQQMRMAGAGDVARAANGTFHGVSAKHLPRYAREWNRFNRRPLHRRSRRLPAPPRGHPPTVTYRQLVDGLHPNGLIPALTG